ncbi:DUF6266 family protein [Algoriphagus winogradskyi]|uniref:Uncharacterized protein n=2 Tax=Algoriphagus TaxID=246875 RepID=A0ABY1PIX7_9BACT|nr:DUF6266 family protein [Algoriphagus winogradskyi]SMP33491.1 hypothetical protein SAMN06265367_108207 [Algoriphagus winogradskyi]
MGIIHSSLLGTINGSMGNLVFYQLNGKTVVRQKPGPRKKPASERQLYQQKAFSIGQKFVTPLREALNFTMKKKGSSFESGTNRTLSWLIKNAILPEEKNPILYPERVKVSKGWLVGLEQGLAVREGTSIRITWQPNAWQGSGRDEDSLFVIAYVPESKRVYTLYKGNYRKTGVQVLELPWSEPELGQVFVYAAFYAQDGCIREFSDSICLGKV